MDCLFFASSFTQSSSFHFRSFYEKYPQEFIRNSQYKIKKIYLNEHTTDTFLAILSYCTNINELYLHNLRPEHVMAIFNNNFNELKKFSLDCWEVIFADELLCQMQKSLETIIIKMVYDCPLIFSANSLRKFLKPSPDLGHRISYGITQKSVTQNPNHPNKKYHTIALLNPSTSTSANNPLPIKALVIGIGVISLVIVILAVIFINRKKAKNEVLEIAGSNEEP
ncbi:3153_t:CDS:2 [Diversispora eburnea]|uniref:3153_t:CDS:1 n=1 Tax=Diversispora eburnea TaxID=1213867 RepID=A0A9N9ATB8_9GLOM|nr:3153_t:CDS:2 [Diversispora eburnea]